MLTTYVLPDRLVRLVSYQQHILLYFYFLFRAGELELFTSRGFNYIFFQIILLTMPV